MSDTVFAPEPAGAPEWLLDAAFAAMVLLPATGLYLDSLSTGLVLGFMVHIFVSLYHGRFGRFRTLTWVVFLGGWAISFLIGFLGYVLPWGQMSFWLAARLPEAIASALWRNPGLGGMLVPLAGGLVVLGAALDVIALQGPRLRTRRAVQVVAGLLALVFVLAAVRDVMHVLNAVPAGPPRPREVAILPSLEFLPLYALLRAGPTKSLGAALPPLLAFLVAAWPWRRAWRFHAAATRPAFTTLWLGAGAGWFGLGLLGTQAPPERWVILASQALALYELFFLVAVPFVLARFLRPTQDRRTQVF